MSATLRAPAPARRTRPALGPLLPAAVARLLTFTPLAIFAAMHWARLVQPSARGDLLAMLAAALAGAVVLLVVARRRPPARWRAATMAVVAIALLLVAFATAGVPSRFVLDAHLWDDLAAGIGQGLSAVPTVTVPYAGQDEWARIVMVLGGSVLIAAAALLAFAVRRDGAVGYPIAAAVALAALYAVAIIQRHTDPPFLAGAVFALLLALFLWLERVELRSAPLAACGVAIAVVLAFVAAPEIDAERPLIDYEEIAESIGRSATTQYDWNHRYGPLNWPRDGREVLRVRAPTRSYWKAVHLVGFDGTRWAQAAERDQDPTYLQTGDPRWLETIRVTVRALRSSQFVAAGTTLRISQTPRTAARRAPGQFETSGQPLRRGNAYSARVYIPRPTAARMRAAGTDYPLELNADYGSIGLQSDPRSGAPRTIDLPLWGQATAFVDRALRETMAVSPYARSYELAQRLRARSATPYEYMRAVERHLRRGYSYTESPPPSLVPLEAFLFDDRIGYCQQFSGAMALLLRLGGVPARVAAGFSPGIYDEERKEYVVRDVDAHSWVEVYFPQIGWVTRDPTPAVSPARSQTADVTVEGADAPVTIGGSRERAPGASPDGAGGAGPSAGEGGANALLPPWAIVTIVDVAIALVLLVVVLARRRRSPTDSDDVAELRRALRRSGRAPQPQLTLEMLAQRFAGTRAEGYVRQLSSARYGYGGAGPSRAERAGLRSELAAGLGLRGRLRAWWALPPRARRR